MQAVVIIIRFTKTYIHQDEIKFAWEFIAINVSFPVVCRSYRHLRVVSGHINLKCNDVAVLEVLSWRDSLLL